MAVRSSRLGRERPVAKETPTLQPQERGGSSEDGGVRHVAAPSGVCALALALILCAITPAAHASPPDASWIPGVYDDDDQDEVIGLVTSATGAERRAGEALLPLLVLVDSPRPAQSGFIRLSEQSFASVRAPPIS